ncbi:MAG: Gfo/Idh/MocA family oxidoreductase [Bacteroidetes bacterium]|nr:Gfo/Idh/MocA family oxidoreductase [Bacteroidota bacterium]
MKRFALIGAAGFIAPRHMRAIRDTGNRIVCALDRFDSVGVLDAYFPNADFFTEFERFDRHFEKLRIRQEPVEYVSICSPNYLHDAHIRFGLRNDAHVICEKPLVLNPWNIDSLAEIQSKTGRDVYNILQLRLHPSIVELRKMVQDSVAEGKYDIDLTYITSRGNWYYSSWKGDLSKSGGIATNIGVHFFDMLSWIFGKVQSNIVHVHSHDRAAGYMELEKARVRWFLSINAQILPPDLLREGKRTYRALTINGDSMEFSDGFTELHTQSYQQIFDGRGFPLDEARTAIEVVHQIRRNPPVGLSGDYHPWAAIPASPHPFD